MDQVISFASENTGVIIAGAIAIVGVALLIKKLGPKAMVLSIVKALDVRFDSDDGQEKLATVYDAVIDMYPIIGVFVSESQFAKWVDEALDKARAKLEG